MTPDMQAQPAMSGFNSLSRSSTILLADDDEDDRELVRDALQDPLLAREMKFAQDGQDLLDYLRHEGRWAHASADAPRPAIILLDLNMPRKDGLEALAEIKQDSSLRRIPVVVLTTSKSESDVASTYDLGGNSYIAKPDTFPELIAVMRAWTEYWFESSELPSGEPRAKPQL